MYQYILETVKLKKPPGIYELPFAGGSYNLAMGHSR